MAYDCLNSSLPSSDIVNDSVAIVKRANNRFDASPQPSGNVDAAQDLPNDEHYDDGFDEDNTTLGIDASESSNAVDEVEPVVNASAIAPESSSITKAPEHYVVA
ncbi:hypothetical protein F442_16076 [Phytophthora nicotianae P10297]|uniref:Uncharacterized protein n=1 Tax=Phytophthora nicotianae P10297 TaxID=1317064 RepID=W2YLE4_PHYNI|nr:hypothetical protein F442_16076 [Phytophthora nicotianae P10297]